MSDWSSDSETQCTKCGQWNTTGAGCGCPSPEGQKTAQSTTTPAPFSEKPTMTIDEAIAHCRDEHTGLLWYLRELDDHSLGIGCDALAVETLLTEVERLRALVPSGLTPTRYDIDGSASRIPADDHRVEMVERCQRDGSCKWAVIDFGAVLSRYGDWEFEPMPSGRTDAFIERTRFNSVAEALAAYRASVELTAARTEGDSNARSSAIERDC